MRRPLEHWKFFTSDPPFIRIWVEQVRKTFSFYSVLVSSMPLYGVDALNSNHMRLTLNGELKRRAEEG